MIASPARRNWFFPVTEAPVHAAVTHDGVTYVDLTGRVAQFEVNPAAAILLSAHPQPKFNSGPNVRVAILPGDGLAWGRGCTEVGASRTGLLKVSGQLGKFVFPPNSQLRRSRPPGMLMRLAADAEWRNPALGSAAYQRVIRHSGACASYSWRWRPRRATRSDRTGAFVPVFQIGTCQGLLPESQQEQRF